ncbi:beta glucosidase 36 [Arabidopsis thaliana]|uniref:Beta glucosidase 36 n=1 Tax=Arabidopsis thaliana TaxID=3702 RepID=A0A2H1ZED6_ARATH|nr:beta glucosidase 36 [Arabidopsis thaliana]AEE32673.2 beta glucosidase 36 [Arabidopsis thaliana]|eukprot:NP_001319196.1 beta glucosidase 36 [Arabidopsis thaliana]
MQSRMQGQRTLQLRQNSCIQPKWISQKNFTFGAATSAYQVEGAAHRALNGWDYFTHRYPERVSDRSIGDLACNSYDLYKDDVKLLKRMNVQAYRFSIAWSRVLPKGRLIGGVDENGITYYNNLINELKANGIEPFVTIFHWDVPQDFRRRIWRLLKPTYSDFKNYAELLFQRFGDRVKFWITLNQPYSLAVKGYGDGQYPPGRCTDCEFGGDSGTEPYIVGHHELLAHMEAVSLYRKRYQKFQGGKIGTTLIGRWFIPLNETNDLDKAAAKREFDFSVLGSTGVRTISKDNERLGDRLPKFTPKQSALLKGSLDFLGLNYYVTRYATYRPPPMPTQHSVLTDSGVTIGFERNGVSIGVKASINFDVKDLRHLVDFFLFVELLLLSTRIPSDSKSHQKQVQESINLHHRKRSC